MKTMLLRRISLLTVLLLSVGGTTAFAQSRASEYAQTNRPQVITQRGDKEAKQERLVQELNLTPQQQQQLQAIRSDAQSQISPIQESLKTERQALMEMMAGTASEGEIRTQHGTVKQLQEQVATARFESMIAMREVLTPEQRQEFASMMQERRQNMQERWGNRDKSRR